MPSAVVMSLLITAAIAWGPGLAHAADANSAASSPRTQAVPAAEPRLDPAMRALLVGVIASVLREAAASPDPLSALGNSLERKLQFALRSPEFPRIAEELIGQAVKDMDPELREPLARFAVAMLNNLRRELLEPPQPRSRPY